MIKIIAEIGWNHMGDMDLAKKMIVAAHKAGADFAKFQTWSVKNLKPGPWDIDGRLEIYKKAELTKEKHNLLKNRSLKRSCENGSQSSAVHPSSVMTVLACQTGSYSASRLLSLSLG